MAGVDRNLPPGCRCPSNASARALHRFVASLRPAACDPLVDRARYLCQGWRPTADPDHSFAAPNTAAAVVVDTVVAVAAVVADSVHTAHTVVLVVALVVVLSAATVDAPPKHQERGAIPDLTKQELAPLDSWSQEGPKRRPEAPLLFVRMDTVGLIEPRVDWH